MEILYRQKYIDQIEKYLGKDYIIVLVGQRRVGKSYTLKMIRSLKGYTHCGVFLQYQSLVTT